MVVDFDVEGIVLVELFVMSERWQLAEQQGEQQAEQQAEQRAEQQVEHAGGWQQVDVPRQAAYVAEAVAGIL